MTGWGFFEAGSEGAHHLNKLYSKLGEFAQIQPVKLKISWRPVLMSQHLLRGWLWVCGLICPFCSASDPLQATLSGDWEVKIVRQLGILTICILSALTLKEWKHFEQMRLQGKLISNRYINTASGQVTWGSSQFGQVSFSHLLSQGPKHKQLKILGECCLSKVKFFCYSQLVII